MLKNRSLFAQGITLFSALVTGCLLFALGAPLPFLFGSLASCLILATFGFPLQGVPLLSTVSRTVLGVAIGASITWAVLVQIPELGPTLILIPVYVAAIAMCGMFYFHRVLGYDKTTSYYCAMPGALQDMVAFGEEAGGNVRSLSLIHATRLLLLVTTAPILLVHVFNASLDRPLGPPTLELPVYHNLLVLVIGITGWQLAKRMRVFGASVVGPILVAVPLSLAGLLTARPSQEILMVAQFFIGIGVGVNYRGITAGEFRRDIVAAGGFVFILLMLAGLFMVLGSMINNLSPVERFLSFWPAGQAEIAILSLAAGVNVGIVVIHHLVRIVLIILGAPLAARFFVKSKD